MITSQDIDNHYKAILNLPLIDIKDDIKPLHIDGKVLNEMLHRFERTFYDTKKN